VHKRLCIFGAGYIGLTTAACLAELGHDVSCVDINVARVESLLAGHVPIHEPMLTELVVSNMSRGRLDFTTDVRAAVVDVDIVFICVPTPQSSDGSADLSAVFDVVDAIAEYLPRGVVLVTKSTVPAGTGHEIHRRLRGAGRTDIGVASNPEFLREGSAVADFMNPDRIVVGADVGAWIPPVTDLFAAMDAPVIVTDIVTAELSKHAANAFLATKLTFVNSLAHLCESVGGDAASLLEVLGSDPRIGRQFLRPGPGWGGSCLPKDTRALAHFSRSIGAPLDQLETTITANDAHFEHVVSRLTRHWRGSLAGVRVAALGLAFKSGTDDMRDSPSLEVIARLVARGATVTAHDPVARPVNDQLRGASFTDSVRDAAADSDVLLVLTEWSEFASLDPRSMRAASPARVVYDTRGILDADAWTAAGFDVMQVGRPTAYCGERETESSAA
jgi:UDPglucose 6-dehydrogenase